MDNTFMVVDNNLTDEELDAIMAELEYELWANEHVGGS
jgi:hypothetical protein